MGDEFDIVSPVNWTPSDRIIKVIGVGGGGCNAVSYMYDQGIQGCCFAVCNTDAQALSRSSVPVKVQMGPGLGAGTNVIKGRNAALESQDAIDKTILDPQTRMVFITAGMGGGTGTGATPVIAKMAKDKGILTVAVVTLPFRNEGNETLSRAIDGIHELEKNVDSMLIINNEKLCEYFGDQLVHEAFPKADEILCTAVKGIIEIISRPGYINVDFEDVKTMMKGSGMALMGRGTGRGETRIDDALKEAFESPLLNDFDLKTAKNVLINITSGKNDSGIKMMDFDEINRKIASYTGNANNFKRGLVWDDDPAVGDTVTITAIATGFKFNDLIGPDINLGNIIQIPRDFRYDRSAQASSEGISLPENRTRARFGDTEGQRTFRFDPDCPPILYVKPGENFSELENTPAIRRI